MNITASQEVPTKLNVALIGSPNCGKTTLFNRLTGSQQTTGNWPGVTVEKKTGTFRVAKQKFILTDLPGIYSLENATHSGLDEQVARQFLSTAKIDILINVVDATCLERQLFLTAQLLHMGLPVVVALNRMDKLEQQHIEIDPKKLSEKLGCPVFPISAYYNQGIDALREQLPLIPSHHENLHFDLPDTLQQSVKKIRELLPTNQQASSCWQALQTLVKPELAPSRLQTFAEEEKQHLETHYNEELALIIADQYFQFAHNAAHASQIQTDKFNRNTTDLIDHWLLHNFWGLPIFLFIMYLVFALSVAIGNLFLDFFDLAAQAIFVDGPTHVMQLLNAPEWLITLLASGVGGGIQVVATFIPVIGALFLLLSILEETGYMQRAALVMDGAMRRLGLSGQAFIPLVVGFGCNIPAVLATRTLPNPKDRIITALMTPFMSCSARLTVYVLFASVFFTEHATLLVFSLYLIGILAAVLTAYILKKTLLIGKAEPLLMELPLYQKPALFNIYFNVQNKMKGFVLGAGKVIIVIVLLINFFNSLGSDGSFGNENQNNSLLSVAAQTATPLVAPLGVTEENWPATVGLITGILAKEVVVGALDALYQNTPESTETLEEYDVWHELGNAVQTIPDNFSQVFTDLTDPLGLEALTAVEDTKVIAKELDVSSTSLDKMAQYFGNDVAAYAYLLLILLYFPCVATFAALRRELGWRWAIYSGFWSMFLGYSVSVSFYQIMTFSNQPATATMWLSIFSVLYIILFITLKRIGLQWQRQSH